MIACVALGFYSVLVFFTDCLCSCVVCMFLLNKFINAVGKEDNGSLFSMPISSKHKSYAMATL